MLFNCSSFNVDPCGCRNSSAALEGSRCAHAVIMALESPARLPSVPCAHPDMALLCGPHPQMYELFVSLLEMKSFCLSAEPPQKVVIFIKILSHLAYQKDIYL